MCLRIHYYLVCTSCNNQFISPDGDHYGETGREVLELARAQGWVRRRVENGSMWDFCPRCRARVGESSS
jgi:hypothetical protein